MDCALNCTYVTILFFIIETFVLDKFINGNIHQSHPKALRKYFLVLIEVLW